MKCPSCQAVNLVPAITKVGVELDQCPNCNGVWLDRGEIYHFVRNTRSLHERLTEAPVEFGVKDLPSPRYPNAVMSPLSWAASGRLYRCEKTQGLWLEAGTLSELISKKLEPRRAWIPHLPKNQVPPNVRSVKVLDRLPSLHFRSIACFLGLFSFLTLMLAVLAEFEYIPVNSVLPTAAIILLLQYIFGPWLTDITLKEIFTVSWNAEEQLPPHLRQFVRQLCSKHKIREPRFGIIEDGAPQAFTYGHSPNRARIVISRGLIEITDPAELEAVVAHEIGHALHWDMALMTVAQIVPLALYMIFRVFSRATKGKNALVSLVIAMTAYFLYVLSEFFVLWLSRIRELHADRFAGSSTGNPGDLSSALIKIAYGLAGYAPKKGGKVSEEESEKAKDLEGLAALGIFNPSRAKNFAVVGYNGNEKEKPTFDPETAKRTMRWEHWNPWAQWYELQSTHPTTARRLEWLSQQSQAMGRQPFIIFDQKQPESYWDEYFVDIAVLISPWIVGIAGLILWMLGLMASDSYPGEVLAITPSTIAGVGLIAFGLLLLLRLSIIYHRDHFPGMSVSALLKRVKVSPVRPVPCEIQGKIVGRGVPGYIFSEDFVFQDETGLMFLDHRQPFALWDFIFGALRAKRFHVRDVVVRGWYRRGPIPYIEIDNMSAGEDYVKSYTPMAKKGVAIAISLIGVWIMLANNPLW